ncbi:Hypothetical predicted protein [Mytilus galloprovincialis]|uniref:Ig-like domain-containing protein n=1 Tax=Mytilus galloprovincialis TaxID=29158 RepID=A0A8B6H9Q8_MYTGA|nr:Hypothetical predicted protein [Mytilus galloprovincialis]
MYFLQYYRFIIYIVRLIETNAEITLEISTDAVLLGKDIVLTCTVHGIENIDRQTTRQWSLGNDDELLCYNGRINNRRKYKENVLAANEFSLTIINVTKVDLNVLYKCRYGFDAASKFIAEDEPIFYLSLRLTTDFIIFKGYLILTCAVNGIRTVDRDVTRQWSMGNDDQLLSYNGRINSRRKYEETVLPGNEFTLKIFNVTEADLNVTYQCRYGFDSANTFIEINEYNYVNPPTPESTSIRYIFEKEMDTINISVSFKKVFPLPSCSLNIDAPNFDVTNLSEYEVAIDVNLSLRLQRRVACDRSFNISCLLGRKQYDVGYLTIKDECSFEVSNACFVTMSIATTNYDKENNQLCFTPENNWKRLINVGSSITWHFQSRHHHNDPFRHTYCFINADFENSSCYYKRIGYSTSQHQRGAHDFQHEQSEECRPRGV